MSVAAFTPVVGDAQMPLGNQGHPLDPLGVEEIQRACAVVKASKGLGSECRFAMVQLHEPAKAAVLAHQPGDAFERSAFLMIFNATSGETHEAVVNLTLGTLVSWAQHHTETTPFGQPPVLVEDFFNCDRIVKAD
ncbi:MAG: primary-amine oxidase, partial [Acidobacteriaceae bacterium]|nr:primary-amine oxidase [Acidobacteriaceae bacterium]